MPRSRLAAASFAALLFVAAADAGDDPPPLKFAWTIPSKAIVTEAMERAGHTATTRCTATLDKEGDGPNLRLHLSDFELVDLDGKPSTDPALAQQVQLTLIMMRVTPDLIIGPEGDVKDVVGLDVAIETVLSELSKNADEAKRASVPKIREQFTAPESQAAMKEKAARAWQCWVAEWTGRTIAEGRGVDGTFPIRCPDGSKRGAPTLWRRMSGASEGPGLVKFTRETVLDGEDAKPVLDSWLKKVAETTGRELPATGLRVVDRALTTCEPATLRPKRVMHEETKVLQLKDGTERGDRERHEYTFDWQ